MGLPLIFAVRAHSVLVMGMANTMCWARFVDLYNLIIFLEYIQQKKHKSDTNTDSGHNKKTKEKNIIDNWKHQQPQ